MEDQVKGNLLLVESLCGLARRSISEMDDETIDGKTVSPFLFDSLCLSCYG